MDANENRELFKQALEEGVSKRIDREIEDSEPCEPSEHMKRFGEALKRFEAAPNGAVLLPGFPEKCEGNGKHPNYECCCDECDYLKLCLEAGKE